MPRISTFGIIGVSESTREFNTMKTLFPLPVLCVLTFCATAADTSLQSSFQIRRIVDRQTPESEPMEIVRKGQDRDYVLTVYVDKVVLMDLTSVASVRVRTNPIDGQSQIAVEFTDSGKERFAKLTRENIDKHVAIIVEGKLYCDPVIRMEISTGEVPVCGDYSDEEANRLVESLTKALGTQ